MSGASPLPPSPKPARPTGRPTTIALRTSLIWHDEVMDDIVSDRPTSITLGVDGETTFVVPDIGLPNKFAIVRPGNRGYLLTLGEHMRGTICIDGVEKSVEEFVRRGGEGDSPGGFRATPISGKDWGVVDLDESGAYKLFFQFVPVEDASPFLTKPVIYAGIAGYAISSIVLTALWSMRGLGVGESVFRGAGLATAALVISSLIWWLVKQESESQASFAFSVTIHAALLIMTYQLYDGHNPFVWPGPRDLTGNYLATRLEPEVPPDPPKPAAAAVANKTPAEAAAKNPDKVAIKTATKGDTGASGGKGDTERARDPNAKPTTDPPKVALFTENNRKVLDNLERNLPTGLSKFQGLTGEFRKGSAGNGNGTGTGVGNEIGGTGTTRGGKGKGQGGGGQVDGDFVTSGPITQGTMRPGGSCVGPNCHGAAHEVKITFADPGVTGDGLTREEIDRVVRARQGIFRACYQKELNRTPGIGGKLVIKFTIGGDGLVKSASTGSGGSFHNEEVEGCVKANVMKLKFPAKGGTSNVNYPFIFSQGG